MKKLFYLVQIFLLIGCYNDPALYNVDKVPPEGILIQKWNVVGPFKSDTTSNNIETDQLKVFGLDESTLKYKDLSKIRNNADTSFKNILVTSLDYKLDFNKIFRDSNSHPTKGVAYAGCIINSSEIRHLKLNFSSNEGAKIWLNNKLLFTNERGESLRLYENYIDLALKEGSNFLLIKVSNLQNQCEMFAAIEKESSEGVYRYKKNFSLDFGNTFLDRNVIENDSVKLVWGMPKGEYKVEIEGPQKATYMMKNEEFINISKLPDGLYTTKFYARGNIYNSRFYKGNIIKRIADLIKIIKAHHASSGNNTVDALEFRFKHLTKPENMGKESYEKRAWDNKMTSLLINLNIQNDLINKKIKPNEATGGLLRSYVSNIDHGIQYYQIHVPTNYNPQKPISMVIELPKFMKKFESPLESYRFANINLFEQFTDLANKYNMIILDPGSRITDRANYNGIDEADLWEAIKDVKNDYNVDSNRMYLRGACLSSHNALKLAVRYPDKFAAISTIAPQFDNNGGGNIWLQQNFPLNFLGNVSYLPFYNIHSKIDLHSPIEVSKRLIIEAHKAGLRHFTSKILPMEFKLFYSEEHLDEIFTFFKKQSVVRKPKIIHFATNQLKFNRSFWITLNAINYKKTALIDAQIVNNVLKINRRNILSYSIDLKSLPYYKNAPLKIIDNGENVLADKTKDSLIIVNDHHFIPYENQKNHDIEGPFAHVFSNSFIVVLGTSGSKDETDQIRAIVDTMNNHWKNRYYSGFRIKKDKELTKEDIQDANLILIGSPESNLVFKILKDKLPIRVSKSFVAIGNKRLNGTTLNYYFIYPNPDNLKRYISVIGSNSMSSNFSLGTEEDITKSFNDISNYGWYDYKVWNPKSSGIISGYFNYKWQ